MDDDIACSDAKCGACPHCRTAAERDALRADLVDANSRRGKAEERAAAFLNDGLTKHAALRAVEAERGAARAQAQDFVKQRNEAWAELGIIRARTTGVEPGEIRGYLDADLGIDALRLRLAAADGRADAAHVTAAMLREALCGVADVLENARRAVSKGSADYTGAFIRSLVDLTALAASTSAAEWRRDVETAARADERAKHRCGVAWPDLVAHDAQVRAAAIEAAAQEAERVVRAAFRAYAQKEYDAPASAEMHRLEGMLARRVPARIRALRPPEQAPTCATCHRDSDHIGGRYGPPCPDCAPPAAATAATDRDARLDVVNESIERDVNAIIDEPAPLPKVKR